MALPVILPGDRMRRAKTAKVLARRALIRAGQKDLARSINTKTPVYGAAAVKGVKALQKRYGLKADGIIGANTWKMLRRKGSRIRRRTHVIRSRRSWGATSPTSPSRKVSWGRGTTFWLHHTVTKAPQTGIAAEKAAMRELQRIAFGREFFDISYSYVVFPSGRIYAGRGFGVSGAHTQGHNDDIGVALCGNYETQKVTDAQKAAVLWLKGKLGAGQMKPHCATYATACPGKNAKATFNLSC